MAVQSSSFFSVSNVLSSTDPMATGPSRSFIQTTSFEKDLHCTTALPVAIPSPVSATLPHRSPQFNPRARSCLGRVDLSVSPPLPFPLSFHRRFKWATHPARCAARALQILGNGGAPLTSGKASCARCDIPALPPPSLFRCPHLCAVVFALPPPLHHHHHHMPLLPSSILHSFL